MAREAHRRQVATETIKVNSLGTGTSVRTFPEAVMGLKSNNTSSLTAFFKMLNTTGWNRKFPCSHERVNSCQESESEINKP